MQPHPKRQAGMPRVAKIGGTGPHNAPDCKLGGSAITAQALEPSLQEKTFRDSGGARQQLTESPKGSGWQLQALLQQGLARGAGC